MELLDEENKKSIKKSNRLLIGIFATIVLLVIALVGVVLYMQNVQSKQFRFYVDGGASKPIAQNLFLNKDGEMYVSINDMASYLGYEVNNGEYNKYNEDVNSCYVMNTYEIAGFKAESQQVYKIVREYDDYEYYTLKQKVISENGKLYTNSEGIELGFNVKFEYNKDKNYVIVYTLDKIVNTYAANLKNTFLTSEKMTFSNKKALKYDLVITQNSQGQFGVQKTTGENVLGNKYKDLRFMESSQDFIVTTPEDKQGIMSTSGGINIEPQYDEIKQLDIDYNLYLIKIDEKYGVINRTKAARYVIWPQYDAIGVDSNTFKNEEISNPYILYDNCIPAKQVGQDKKEVWTIFDKNGKNITNNTYDGLGYIKGTSKNTQGNNILLIPEKEGIIVSKNGLYGIINSSGKTLIQPQLKEIYSVTSNGKTAYYMVYGEENKTENIIDILNKAYGTQTSTDKKNNESSTEETQNNENTTNTRKNNTVVTN